MRRRAKQRLIPPRHSPDHPGFAEPWEGYLPSKEDVVIVGSGPSSQVVDYRDFDLDLRDGYDLIALNETLRIPEVASRADFRASADHPYANKCALHTFNEKLKIKGVVSKVAPRRPIPVFLLAYEHQKGKILKPWNTIDVVDDSILGNTGVTAIRWVLGSNSNLKTLHLVGFDGPEEDGSYQTLFGRAEPGLYRGVEEILQKQIDQITRRGITVYRYRYDSASNTLGLIQRTAD